MNSSKVGVAVFMAGLLLVGSASSFVHGQRGGRGFVGGRGRFGDGVSGLLKLEQVQKEIAVTAEQKVAFQKLVEVEEARASNDVSKFDFVAFEKLPETEKAKSREELSKQRKERTKQLDEKIKSLLNPDQWSRLNQIRIQQEGVRSLSRNEVQKQLGLNAEQITKIKTLIENADDVGGGQTPLDLSAAARRKAREENDSRRQAFEKNMAAVLTPDQTSAWTKLKGTTFEISR